MGFLSFLARAALDLVAFGIFPGRVVDAGLLDSLRESGGFNRNVALSSVWAQAVVDFLVIDRTVKCPGPTQCWRYCKDQEGRQDFAFLENMLKNFCKGVADSHSRTSIVVQPNRIKSLGIYVSKMQRKRCSLVRIDTIAFYILVVLGRCAAIFLKSLSVPFCH